MGNNVVVPDRQSFETMEQVRLDATVQTILQQGNVNFKDNVTSVADLPATGNTVDDFRMTLDTGWVYKWDGAAWVQPNGSGVQSVTVELTPSQILDLWQTPVEILPAPGPNKIIVPYTAEVIFQYIEGGTTNFSPVAGTLSLIYNYDFGYNPSYANTYQGRQLAGNMSYSSLGQVPYITPSSNVFSALFGTYVYNPVNKGINAQMIFDINNPYTPPTVGDRNIRFRFNYKIVDVDPFVYSLTNNPFTLKTSCSSGPNSPFDGTETNRSVDVLTTTTSSGYPLETFVLNPVYEGAGVWNLGDGLLAIGSVSAAPTQGYRAASISCIKGGNTITFFTRGIFGSAAGNVITLSGSYV